MDPEDKETWGDSEHRLAQISETTVIHKNIVEVSNLFLGFCPVWNGYINYSSRFLFEYHTFYFNGVYTILLLNEIRAV